MQVTALKLIKSWSFPSGNLLSAFHLNIKFWCSSDQNFYVYIFQFKM
jgi:hypothetical protein